MIEVPTKTNVKIVTPSIRPIAPPPPGKPRFDDAEHDFEALAIANKLMREERYEKFGEWYEKLLESDNVISVREDNFKFIINTNDYGIIDFFPKANKVLICKKNKWIKPGLRWIVKKILKQ